MPGHRGTVAVIDDDASVRGALLRLFRAQGFEVSLFSTAEEYLSFANREEFTCLVIDVRLPGMGGLELLELLRGECPTPALIITAHDDEQSRTRAVAAGAMGFFRKPCDNRQVLGAVHRALALSRLGDEP